MPTPMLSVDAVAVADAGLHLHALALFISRALTPDFLIDSSQISSSGTVLRGPPRQNP